MGSVEAGLFPDLFPGLTVVAYSIMPSLRLQEATRGMRALQTLRSTEKALEFSRHQFGRTGTADYSRGQVWTTWRVRRPHTLLDHLSHMRVTVNSYVAIDNVARMANKWMLSGL
jgi:hypothetical protein